MTSASMFNRDFMLLMQTKAICRTISTDTVWDDDNFVNITYSGTWLQNPVTYNKSQYYKQTLQYVQVPQVFYVSSSNVNVIPT